MNYSYDGPFLGDRYGQASVDAIRYSTQYKVMYNNYDITTDELSKRLFELDRIIEDAYFMNSNAIEYIALFDQLAKRLETAEQIGIELTGDHTYNSLGALLIKKQVHESLVYELLIKKHYANNRSITIKWNPDYQDVTELGSSFKKTLGGYEIVDNDEE